MTSLRQLITGLTHGRHSEARLRGAQRAEESRTKAVISLTLVLDSSPPARNDGVIPVITTRYDKLLLVTVFLALFFFFLRPPTDPDLGWHLKYGQMMVEDRQLPRVDNFSYTMSGYPWANSYWLSEVLIYGGYKLFGFVGLSIFFSLIATLALLLSFKGCTFKEGATFHKDGFKFISILFIAVLLIVSFVGTRPQTISLLFFAATLLLLRHSRYSWLPWLFLFWANFHAGFVLGLAVVWLWFLGRGLENWRLRELENWRMGDWASRRRAPNLIPQFSNYPILCTLATLINPYGLFLWQTIWQDTASFEIKQNIMEWLAPTLRSDFGPVFFVYLLVLLLFVGASWRRQKFSFLLPLFFFIVLSLSSLRHIPLLVVFSAPFLFRTWSFKEGRPFIFWWALLTFFGTSLFALGGIVGSLYKGEWTNKELRGVGVYPYLAVRHLKEHPLTGRVLNTYGWGGYLLMKLPDFKTFIDGRMPGWRYPGQPSLFREYLTAVNLRPGWKEVLEKYQVEWLVLERNQALPQALSLLPEWRKVYEDELAVVMKKD